MNIIKRALDKIIGRNSIEDHRLYKQLLNEGATNNVKTSNSENSFGRSNCEILDKFDEDFYNKINKEGTIRINKDADLKYLDFSILIGKAFVDNKWDDVLSLLDDHVILTLYNDKEIIGKENVINYWIDWEARYHEPYCGTRYNVKFCKYFSRTSLLISPYNSKPMYVVARFENTVVKDLLLVETPLQDPMIRYWDLDHEALSFDNCYGLYTDLGNDIEPKVFRIPCMTCGCRSENMQWYEFHLRRDPLEYDGELSLCPECMKFVEYRPTLMFRR